MRSYKKLYDEVAKKYKIHWINMNTHLFTKEELKRARNRALYYKKKGIRAFE